MYINYRQSNWLEWLATAKFVFNNKVYIATKLLPFKVINRREPKMFWYKKKEEACKSEGFGKRDERDIWGGKSDIDKISGENEKIYE